MIHPLDKFRYCPKCGSTHFEIKNEKAKKCADCGFEYYFNSSAATVAVIENGKGQILVARRGKEPAIGTYDLPGGFVDLNETAEEAMAREVLEETGMKVSSLEYLFSIPNKYIYSDFEVQTLDMFFKCSVEDFSGMKAKDDVAELFFIDKDKLNHEDFGLHSIRQGVKLLKYRWKK
ncbi:MAG: NUDIX domain-containing protein [Fermentimonas sp.]|jgi:NAD+ diphosphatase